jgi:anti-sigma factor RsiW
MKPEPETTWSPRDELEWTAFRYIANELPEADVAAFERQLADDQKAREAVARCVQITHAVVALEEARSPASPPAEPEGDRRRQRRWSVAAVVIAAAAVCCAFWIGAEFAQRDRDEPGDQVVKDHPQKPTPSANRGSLRKPEFGAVDPSAIIATWLNFDAAVVLDPERSQAWEEPAKPSSAPPAEGSFNWVIAAVDDAPLAVPVPPVPGKTKKEPN